MSLRLRLIVAFFLLSVVPLAAVTLYTYTSNARALREAAGLEAQSLAGELTQRMQFVTAQISDRVEHLMEMPREPETTVAATTGRPAPAAQPKPPTPAPPPDVAPAATPAAAEMTPEAARSLDAAAEALGEVAMLLNNIEVRGMRGPREGRPPTPPEPGSAQNGRFRVFRGERGRPGEPSADKGVPAPAPVPAVPPAAPAPPVSVPQPGVEGPATGALEPHPPLPHLPPSRAEGPAAPGEPPLPGAGSENDRITFDMMPIRREIIQQLVGSSEDWQKLTPEQRQKIVGEVNQRMLGIVQGIHISAAEMQKKVSEAQRAADDKAKETALAERVRAAATAKARAAAAAASGAGKAGRQPAAGAQPRAATRAASAQTQRHTALSGSRLDVKVERNGEVLREANAEVNLPNLLATVFTTTRRERGEVPFAVSKDGHLYTPTEDDRRKLEVLGGNIVNADAPAGTTVLPDWVVVTTADPTGSGLKFGIARPVGESLDELRRAGARNAGLGLACIGLALIGIVPLSGRLTRNLSTLNDGVHRIAQGDYSARVPVRSSDEVGRLARAFNQMAEDIERNQHAMIEQERIRRELELGRQIQHDMLPRAPLRLGLTEIEGVSVPAREVGGDFFNYFTLAGGQVALLVGDVSGKGVGAALLMANIQASLRTRFELGQDLAAIAREIDVDIERNTPGPVYATLFMGMFDPAARVIRYVNAGHNPQYILRGDGTLAQMSASGLPVGLLAGRGYTEGRAQLAPGDRLFFYTDGCVEAESESGEMFGAERLEALLKASAGAEDLLARVETAVNAFRGTREPFDDATMMVVKVG